jgi:hypothetical protein
VQLVTPQNSSVSNIRWVVANSEIGPFSPHYSTGLRMRAKRYGFSGEMSIRQHLCPIRATQLSERKENGVIAQNRISRMAAETPDHLVTSPSSIQAAARGVGATYRIGVAVRPTLLFISAFALNATPHEAAHAATAYLLGFSSTLYQMWVNPDEAAASPRQSIAIALAGPVFSLAVGLISLLLYRRRYSHKPIGLLLLMLAIIALYIPLGGSIGGDIHLALGFGGASKLLMNAISIVAILILSTMMYFMGNELASWAPPWFSRREAVLCTTVGPWLIGHALTTLVYLPLPKFLIVPNLIGSAFWIFAVIGSCFSNRTIQALRPIRSLTSTDLVVTAAALLMVRLLVHGVRLAHQ